MAEKTDGRALQHELYDLATYLEDYDPNGSFLLKQEITFFSQVGFRLPVYLKSGRVSLLEALKVAHGPAAGRFLLASSASSSSDLTAIRMGCLERTLRASLHGLDWRGEEIQVRCDPRELSQEVMALIGAAIADEVSRRRCDGASEFLLPWRRLPAAQSYAPSGYGPHEPSRRDPKVAPADAAQSAASALGIGSPIDLSETALLSIFPTACASRGLKMDDCTTLVRGGGSLAFRIADAINARFGSPVRVELSGRRYRPAGSRNPSALADSGGPRHGRWEPDDKDSSSHPEVVVLLGGNDKLTAESAGEIKSSLAFHVHRESLTSEGEKALRNRGTVVVPRLLLRSVEELAAHSLSDPALSHALTSSDEHTVGELTEQTRGEWRQRLLACWERILAKTKEEQCTSHEAVLHLGARELISTIKVRQESRPEAPPNTHAGLGDA